MEFHTTKIRPQATPRTAAMTMSMTRQVYRVCGDLPVDAPVSPLDGRRVSVMFPPYRRHYPDQVQRLWLCHLSARTFTGHPCNIELVLLHGSPRTWVVVQYRLGWLVGMPVDVVHHRQHPS